MQRAIFDSLGPVCPACRIAERGDHRLTVAIEETGGSGHVDTGIVRCSHDDCQLEYPVVRGLPILAPDVRGFLATHLAALSSNPPAPGVIQAMLLEAAGPGSHLEATWSQLSSYGADHFGEFTSWPARRPSVTAQLLQRGIELAARSGLALGDGPIIDLGTGPGRSAFELARLATGPVLGVDLSPQLIGLARDLVETGSVQFPLRRVGLRYDWLEARFPLPDRSRLDFWIADAVRLPFAESAFSTAVALNLLDCVYGPLDLLKEMARVVRPGGLVVIASPYDWNAGATPLDAWIGGHSPRGFEAGSSEAILRRLLTAGGHPASIRGFRLVAEDLDVPWEVRVHDRSTVSYRVHLVIAERI